MEDEKEFDVMVASRDLDDYDILALPMISAAVPYETTTRYRSLIWAAMVTFAFGNRSVDHVLKRYSAGWTESLGATYERNPQRLALRSALAKVHVLSAAIEKSIRPTSLGEICAKSALCRLDASFKCAYGLVRKGYIFELDAVVRLILEQLAWAYSVKAMDDDEVTKCQPPACIARFKVAFPNSGRLYGVLSKAAHIDPEIIDNYKRFHDKGTPVVRRSVANSLESGRNLANLMWVYGELILMLYESFRTAELSLLVQRLRQDFDGYVRAAGDLVDPSSDAHVESEES